MPSRRLLHAERDAEPDQKSEVFPIRCNNRGQTEHFAGEIEGLGQIMTSVADRITLQESGGYSAISMSWELDSGSVPVFVGGQTLSHRLRKCSRR